MKWVGGGGYTVRNEARYGEVGNGGYTVRNVVRYGRGWEWWIHG